MNLRGVFRKRRGLGVTVVSALSFLTGNAVAGQSGYQRAPRAVQEVLNAPATPRASVGRARDIVLLYSPVPYPPIAELSQPFERLAGLRIDAATNGPHAAARFNHFVLKRVADGKETKVAIPADFLVGQPFWSPEGHTIAFRHATQWRLELWVADARSGEAHAIAGVALNGAMTRGGPGGGTQPCTWMPDSSSLLCQTIPTGRGAPPQAPQVPAGPRIQESFGKAAPVATFEDLLENAQDEKLFDYFATSQLALVDAASGKVKPVGAPAIFGMADPAPDGEHILVGRVHRPYSYLVPEQFFPRDVDVWDLQGHVTYKVANLPLQENI